jgi:hypothetical protein
MAWYIFPIVAQLKSSIPSNLVSFFTEIMSEFQYQLLMTLVIWTKEYDHLQQKESESIINHISIITIILDINSHSYMVKLDENFPLQHANPLEWILQFVERTHAPYSGSPRFKIWPRWWPSWLRFLTAFFSPCNKCWDTTHIRPQLFLPCALQYVSHCWGYTILESNIL